MFTAKEKRQLYLVGMMRGHCNVVAVLEDWFENVREGDLDEDAMFRVERMIDAVKALKADICDGDVRKAVGFTAEEVDALVASELARGTE